MVLGGSKLLPADSEPSSSEKLRSFNRAVKEARGKIQDLYGQDQYRRQPRHTIDDMLASFAQTSSGESEDNAMAEAANAWYRDFQTGHKKSHTVSKQRGTNYESNYLRDMQNTEIGKVKQKYKDTAVDPIILVFETTMAPFQYGGSGLTYLDIKLKQAQEILNEHEKTSKRDPYRVKEYHKKAELNDDLPEFENRPVPDGLYEQTLLRLDSPKWRPNNLLHEANYKLSKIEQEASENAQRKIPPKGRGLNKRSSYHGFNPMNEIKLKTSNRLMLKGMGPSLPSNALVESQHAHLNQEGYMSDDGERRQQCDGLSPMTNKMRQSPEVVSSGGHNMLDLPQSYDYRLPPYDRFHALSQRQMPNMVDYLHPNRRSVGDPGRYKREHTLNMTLATTAKVAVNESGTKAEQLDIPSVPALKESEPKVEEQQDVKVEPDKEPIDSKVVGKATAFEKVQVEAEAKSLKVRTDIEVKPTEPTELKDDAVSVSEADISTKPEVGESAQDSAVKVESIEAKTRLETDAISEAEGSLETQNKSNSHAVLQSVLEQPQVQEKSQAAASIKDAVLQESIKLTVEESFTSRPADEVSEEPERSKIAPGTPHLPNPDAVVKLLANELSHFSGDKDRNKRHIQSLRRRWSPRKNRRSKRSIGEEQQPPECPERTKRMADPLLDDLEDHNGNHLHFGDLESGLLMSDVEEETAPYGEDEASLYDASSVQVPMMNQRANGQQQQQQQQQQQPQQQQQQQPQQLQQPSNFKASFNLTNFFNELQKMQKNRPLQLQENRPAQQQQQQQLQQQQQQSPIQHQYLPQQQHFPQKPYLPKQQYLPPQQQAPLQTQQKQLIAPPLMKQSAVHRYFGPFFNKQVKNNMLSTVDPCITQVEPLTRPSVSITIDPNCISITTPVPNMMTESTTPGFGGNKTSIPSMTNTTDTSTNATDSGGADQGKTSGPAVPTGDVCYKPDALRLNVSINANVCGDPKTKQFYGNGSINMQPAFDQMNTDLMLDWADSADSAEHGSDDTLMQNDDRYAREAGRNWRDNTGHRRNNRWGKEKSKGKKEYKPESSKCSGNAEFCDDSLEKLITGKTSENM
ncbi:uncharacterized protein LOC117187766 [Drosophila miranda]|uniref:uncharacterized protein LOC117187766 n=1 Tax=Drosophila miranda TaxID=7229 RepID=UPI00143F55ED|nr:uncharacterized protein LOC117187766 [Drosophila miranda]